MLSRAALGMARHGEAILRCQVHKQDQLTCSYLSPRSLSSPSPESSEAFSLSLPLSLSPPLLLCSHIALGSIELVLLAGGYSSNVLEAFCFPSTSYLVLLCCSSMACVTGFLPDLNGAILFCNRSDSVCLTTPSVLGRCVGNLVAFNV